MTVLTWDGTGTIVVHKKLDAGKFELPRATSPGEQHLLVSDAISPSGGTSNAESGPASSSGLRRPRLACQYFGASSRCPSLGQYGSTRRIFSRY
jgi:hypothetical protein